MLRRSTPKVAESGVLRACLDLLAAEKIWHRRWNCGAVKTGKRFFRFGQKGDADILCIPWIKQTCDHMRELEQTSGLRHQGYYHMLTHPLWVECKSDNGKQTTWQAEFQTEVKENGHHYLLVRDVDTLRNWLKERGLTR